MADNNKMLIDATHPEETRVVVLRGGRVEEFDYESAARKLLRGNIYLAKVTRVEPALQAAFVDYGGNRHGFLAFNEIHPDYYQIPVADRLALIEEEAAIEAEEEAEADARAERLEKRRSKSRRGGKGRSKGSSEDGSDDGDNDNDGDDDDTSEDTDRDDQDYAELDDDGENDRDADDDDDDRDDDRSDADEIAARSVSDDENGTAGESRGGDDARDTDADPDNDNDTASGSGPKSIAQSMARDDVLKGDPENVSEPTAESHAEAGAPAAAPSAQDESSEQSAEATASEDTPAIDQPTVDEPAFDTASEPSDDDEIAAQAKAQDEDDNGDTDEENGDENDNGDDNGDSDTPEEVASEADAMEELPARPRRSRRSYKIQEVIKRRQVLLIQVVKEERGNKGAALTTYLSLAGRYTVLMPNTARGGGISRKITQPQDRKRLKAIANELEVPEGMGLIIRTAGAARTKQEIRRDFEYLLRLWESVREMTLQSTAPSLVYEEGDLIKRSIRDLYNKEIDEVIVAGDEAHRSAKDFMNMLMPSHAKNVTRYTDPEPLFTRYQIERQLNAMFSPTVTLKSGGYLVINQTEALVAIDVNSGRSTREFSIEETALHTNLEASDEIARQLKLRDLAGLIVIDFIDMEEKRNNRKVEHRLKDALRFDRARIQVGRISHFGLMEMSRQRMRTGVLEGSTSQCAHCQGTGIIRSTESVALAVLRGLEDAVMARSRGPLIATTTATVALYILNNKREFIIEMEKRHGWSVSVQASDKLAGANFTIEKGAPSAETKTQRRPERSAAVSMDWGFEDQDADEEETSSEAASGASAPEQVEARGDTDDNRKRRRRRRRGGRRGDKSSNDGESRSSGSDDEDAEDIADASGDGGDSDGDGDENEVNAKSQNGSDSNGDDDDNQRARRGRRRGRRGGRRNRERNAQGRSGDDAADANDTGSTDDAGSADDFSGDDEHADAKASGGRQHPGEGPQPTIGEDGTTGSDDAEPSNEASTSEGDEDATGGVKPRRRSRRSESAGASSEAADDAVMDAADGPAAVSEPETQPAPELQSAPEPAPEAEKAPVQSEPQQPKLQRVRVGPDVSGDDQPDSPAGSGEAGESDAKPARRGWWQRRLMGE